MRLLAPREQARRTVRASARWAVMVGYLVLPVFPRAALIIPLFAFLLRPKRLRVVRITFVAALSCALAGYLLLGAAELRPVPLSATTAAVRTAYAVLSIGSLFLLKERDAELAVHWLAIGIVGYVMYEGASTLMAAPDIALTRLFLQPGTGQEIASTDQINAMALACGYLLLVRRSTVVAFAGFGGVMLLSSAYANRTGALLTAGLLIAWALFVEGRRRGRLFIAAAVALGGILVFAQQLIAADYLSRLTSRFAIEGLESSRYQAQLYGITNIISGRHPLGGAQATDGGSSLYWYHNLFLDAYRVGGFPVLLLFILVAAISLRWTKRRTRAIQFLWWATLAVACTSVVIEGFSVEYYIVFAVFSLPVLTDPPARKLVAAANLGTQG